MVVFIVFIVFFVVFFVVFIAVFIVFVFVFVFVAVVVVVVHLQIGIWPIHSQLIAQVSKLHALRRAWSNLSDEEILSDSVGRFHQLVLLTIRFPS